MSCLHQFGLSSWYHDQQMGVHWKQSYSDSFFVSNGVRQGSVLSPILFRVYLDGLLDTVSAMLVVTGVVILLVLSLTPMILFYWLPLLQLSDVCSVFVIHLLLLVGWCSMLAKLNVHS